MGGFGGWHRPPMHHHRSMGGFSSRHMGGMHMDGFGGAFGGGGNNRGGGAGRCRRSLPWLLRDVRIYAIMEQANPQKYIRAAREQ